MGITERIDAITHLKGDRLQPVLAAPKSVKIELTGRCNFSCGFCARGDGLRRQEEMDRDLYRRLVREMHAAGVEELGMFYLGESFLCGWLAEAIEYAKIEGFPYVFLTTNGSLCSAGRLESVFKAGLDSLKFSFNFADEAQFAQVTGTKAALYERVRTNVMASRLVRDKVEAETGHRCGLYASYIEYDGEQGEKMAPNVEWLRGIVDEVYALPLYNQGGFCSKKLRDQHEAWEQTAGNMGRVGALVPPLPCWAVFSEGHITWDGQLSACCFDHNASFTMADLTKVSFEEGWNSQVFQDLRAAHLRKDVRGTACESCVAWQ